MYSLQAKCGLMTVFVRFTEIQPHPLFSYCIWLLFSYLRAELSIWNRLYGPKSLKYLLFTIYSFTRINGILLTSSLDIWLIGMSLLNSTGKINYECPNIRYSTIRNARCWVCQYSIPFHTWNSPNTSVIFILQSDIKEYLQVIIKKI